MLLLSLRRSRRSAAQASAAPREITVYAAASLTDAFSELGSSMEQAHSRPAVRFNFAGSQQLALQIEQGAPADVFASADQRWMSYVVERDLMAGRPMIFARNRLVVIVPKTNPARIGGLQDLARRGIKLVARRRGGAGRQVQPGDAPPGSSGAPGFPPEYGRGCWRTWCRRRRT